MHGKTDADEAEDRCFFIEVVNKCIHDAILNHNIVFLNTFNNTMKEVLHGYPIDQVGPAYYNIPHLSTKGTSHQEAALTSNDDVRAVQSSFEQV